MKEEIWKKIPILNDAYSASSLGRIKRDIYFGKDKSKPPCILKAWKTSRGYYQVRPCINGKCKTFTIHTLIALTFIGEKAKGYEVNHKDTNKENNRNDNLEYMTKSENTKHAYAHGRIDKKGEKHHLAKLTECIVKQIRILYKTRQYTQENLGRKFNISQSHVKDIVKYRRWKHI